FGGNESQIVGKNILDLYKGNTAGLFETFQEIKNLKNPQKVKVKNLNFSSVTSENYLGHHLEIKNIPLQNDAGIVDKFIHSIILPINPANWTNHTGNKFDIQERPIAENKKNHESNFNLNELINAQKTLN